MCRASWSRSVIIYMAVNLTSTSTRLVRLILRIIPKLIGLWLTFKTSQCCKDAKVVWVRRLPRQISRRVQQLGPVGTLTVNCLRCAPTPYRFRRLQSASSPRTFTCDTIRRDGCVCIQCSRIPPLLLEQMFNTLLTELVHLILGVHLFHC